jgi:GH35 family endo-1,4-beta-xylanase
MTRNRCLAAAVALLAAGTVYTVAPPKMAAAASSWTNSASSGPPAETGAAMAWDAATATDVLLTTDGQTWTWNGSTWAQLSPAHSPGVRSNAAMAYDAARALVVLFGGVSGTNTLQDTWTWNGTDWTHRVPSNSPPWRGGASMAWDGKAQKLLMFGGFDPPGVFYNDTWEWDGTNWNEQLANFDTAAATGVSGGAAAPAPRTQAQMSEDAANQTIVLFGGTSPQGLLSDTWIWYDSFQGGRWIPTTPTQTPPPRFSGAFGYAAASGAEGPVLFGGVGANSSLLQDTWGWDGRGWSRLSSTGAPSARRGAVGAAGPNGSVVVFGGSDAGGLDGDTWTWSGTIDAAPLAAPTIISCPGVTVALPTTTGTGTLRGAAAVSHPGLYIGAALTAKEIYTADAEQQITSGSQFNIITSSNQMYWSAMESQQGIFNFCDGDQFVAYAQAYHQALRLHNFIAGTDALNQSPNWVLSPDYPWTATSLSAVMKQWITTAIDHFRGKVSVYDVVNEAIRGDGTPQPNVFAKTIGYPKYVEEAFQYANAANPQGALLYDDEGDWLGPKLTALENLITDLHNTGNHIDAVGMEFVTAGPTVESQNVATAMATLAAAPYSVKTAVTQMMVPFYNTLTPNNDQLQQQAGVYNYVLSACLAPASNCFMFMMWSVADTYTLPASVLAAVVLTPSKVGTTQFGGALFDVAYQPRPAFGSVLALLQ